MSGRLPGGGESVRWAALREAIRSSDPPLEPFVEDVLGVASRIPVVARDPAGRVYVVLGAARGEDRERLTDALAQAAWLAPRLADWQKLAPELHLQPDCGVGAVLVCPGFDIHTQAAARALGAEKILLLQLAERRSPSLPQEEKSGAPPRAIFRTRLREEDLEAPSPPIEGTEFPPGDSRTTIFGTR